MASGHKGARAPEQCLHGGGVTGPRSRRARRGNPLGRVRVPLRQKAPRFSRRCCLSRGGIRGGSWPGRSRTRDLPDPAYNRAGDPGARSVTRRARANIVRDTRIAFSRAFRPTNCLVQVVARRPSMRQRIERPTQPASVGAGAQRSESSSRVRGSKARRVCPRVVSRLQKSASVVEAQRSAYPVATGLVDGSLAGRPERARR